MIDTEIKSPAFHRAQLRSECFRIIVLLSIFGSLLVLVLIRGVMSRAQGRRGEAWPFAVLLAIMTAYEVIWLRFIRRAIQSNRGISTPSWIGNIFIESLLPTIMLFLQIYTPLHTLSGGGVRVGIRGASCDAARCQPRTSVRHRLVGSDVNCHRAFRFSPPVHFATESND